MEYLENLKWLRNDFDSTIPQEVLHCIGGTHKVSSGWFQKVYNALIIGKQKRLIGEEYAQRYEKYLTESNIRNRLTTREDIDFVDSLLTELITKLVKK
jgi:hypothetical protein